MAQPPPNTASDTVRSEYRSGSSAASTDIARGVVRYEIVGFPAPDSADLAREAKARYGIEVVFRGCIPGPRIWYDRGYLDTVVQHLAKRYGRDPIPDLHKELMKKFSGPS